MTEPSFTEGDLVKVAFAHDEVEGEFLQGLLREEGIPSLLRRSRGFDVPDFLAAGPRDVLVPASAAQIAHDVLLDAELESLQPESGTVDTPRRVLAGLLIAVALVALVVCVVVDLIA
ncbi:MAG TPA: hypothetical protein VIJ39_12650 [Solirubrobacteraceae bacterium]